ncbi:MAG: NAD(P)-dependent oxidoreductase [Planctomycetes bacterium]|nr:NAD(P)-dependent oxidoreductase [Planctomycetota bacterium]
MSEAFFVTGAQGCIGAWVVRKLLQRGATPWIFDASDDRRRLRLVAEEAELERARFVRGDVTDGAAVRAALERSGAKRVIHLAGLQVPTCRAEPVKGALVNVIGTLNVLEAARACGVERVAYASSAAVYGKSEDDSLPVDESVATEPATHYGVFKKANEGNARVCFLEHGLSSVGLRPLTVYGVGRDQGLTSDPTKAIVAALRGQEFTIRFGGRTDFLYVEDAAEAFVACAERAPAGAHVFNVHGESTTVAEFVAHARRELGAAADRIGIDGPPIPIADAMDGAALERAIPGYRAIGLREGVGRMVEGFRALQRAGRLGEVDLPS